MSSILQKSAIVIVVASTIVMDLFANEAPLAKVNVAPIKQQISPDSSISGTLISTNSAKVAARINGRLTYVAPIGSRIAEGDVIARIDNKRFSLQHSQQTALISSLEHHTKFLNQERARLTKLSKDQLAAVTELESITSQYNESHAKLMAQRALLKQIELNIQYLELLSPFTGVVTKRYCYLGETVDIASPVVQLVSTDQVEVSAFVTLEQLAGLSLGQQVGLSSSLGKSPATISAIVPVADPRSHQVEIRIAPQGDNHWPVGLNIEVKLALPQQDSLLVHRDAVILQQDSTKIFVIDQQERAQEINVTLGGGTGSYIRVTGEIAAGDRAVIRGAERLVDQQKVEVIASNAGLVVL